MIWPPNCLSPIDSVVVMELTAIDFVMPLMQLPYLTLDWMPLATVCVAMYQSPVRQTKKIYLIRTNVDV